MATTSQPISSVSHSPISPPCVVPTAYVINHGVTMLSKAASCECGSSLFLCCLLKKAKLSLVSSVLWNLPEPSPFNFILCDDSVRILCYHHTRQFNLIHTASSVRLAPLLMLFLLPNMLHTSLFIF